MQNVFPNIYSELLCVNMAACIAVIKHMLFTYINLKNGKSFAFRTTFGSSNVFVIMTVSSKLNYSSQKKKMMVKA